MTSGCGYAKRVTQSYLSLLVNRAGHPLGRDCFGESAASTSAAGGGIDCPTPTQEVQ